MEDLSLTSGVPSAERDPQTWWSHLQPHCKLCRTAWGSRQPPCCAHASHSIIQLGSKDTDIPQLTYTKLLNAVKHPLTAASDQHQTRSQGRDPTVNKTRTSLGRRESTQDGRFLTDGKSQPSEEETRVSPSLLTIPTTPRQDKS